MNEDPLAQQVNQDEKKENNLSQLHTMHVGVVDSQLTGFTASLSRVEYFLKPGRNARVFFHG